MKKRYYKDEFINKEIEKIYRLKEKNVPVNFPEIYCVPEYYKEKFTKEIQQYVKYRNNNAYVQGFWAGYCLRDGQKDSE